MVPPTQSRRSSGEAAKLRGVLLHRHLEKSLAKTWRPWKQALEDCAKKPSEKRVHQLRVGTRRMLAVLHLVALLIPEARHSKVLPKLKRFLKRFAPLRDLQVQRLALPYWTHQEPELKQYEKKLRKRERRMRKQLTGWIRKLHRSEVRNPLREITATLRQSQETLFPIPQLNEVLQESFENLLFLRKKLNLATPDTFHRLRVAIKKFRYMVESLAPIFPAVDKSDITRMQTCQRMLGEIQDLDVLYLSLERFARKRSWGSTVLKKIALRRSRRMTLFLRRSSTLLPTAPHADSIQKRRRTSS